MAHITSLDFYSPMEGMLEGRAEIYFNTIEDFTELERRMTSAEGILNGDPYYSPRKVVVRCQFCKQWGVRECACGYCGGAVE